MSAEIYEMIALLMRYIFVVLGALILWRAYRWLRRDARAYQREMKSLPDAGLVGEIVDLYTGASQPLPREGTIGSGRDCDIRLKYPGVKYCHALFAFEEGKGIRIAPRYRRQILMEGIEMRSFGYALHGTQLQIGDAHIRIRLFAGLKVPHPAQFAPEMDEGYGMEQEIEEQVPISPFEMPYGFSLGTEQAEQYPEQPIGYVGNYDDTGEMTWQFAAYPLEELRRAQQALEDNGDVEEGIPYQSPLPRRRRGDRR